MEQSEDWLTGHRYMLMNLREAETIPVQIMEPFIPKTAPA
jgi:hypothetical protein